MRIGGPSRISGNQGRGAARRGAPDGDRFGLEPDDAAGLVAGISRPQSAGGIEALLALQAVDDPLFARKKTVRRGHALLDALDAIKADLLVGRLSEGRLNRIVALVGQARAGADPTLEAIVDEIELRARVELAKLGVF